MKFIVKEYIEPTDTWVIIKIDPLPIEVVVEFEGRNINGWISKELAPLLAGDYCDFLNDKYCDKEINSEWGEIDIEKRIEYHEKEIEKLRKGNCRWNGHGNGVI